MNGSSFITDVTRDTFTQAVLEQSRQVPVLVDYWAEWCGPCKMQLPVLEAVTAKLQGKLQVAKVNTDEQRTLAEEHSIRSLPTLRLYHQGTVVQEVIGAQTESALLALIEPYLERESDQVRELALQAYAAGRHQEALTSLREALVADPDNTRVALDYVRLSLQQGHCKAAAETLAALPHEVREGPEAAALKARIEFADAVADAPARAELEAILAKTPTDSAARYRLAARQVLDEDYDAALDQLMELLRRDPRFNDEAARKGLLAVFALLGDDDPRVARYRRQMFSHLH